MTTLLITGGTLDKDYQPLSGELDFEQTHLSAMLKQNRVQPLPTMKTLMLKDSLAMTQADRQTILEACLNQASQRIVITHGTDTMVQTARFLLAASDPDLHAKTVVLTGAMRPWALGRSDADFNLGAALMAAQCLTPGVYVCMNGQVFPADRVEKNRASGRFERLSSPHPSHS
ncbi:MAG: asparaginase domain-containing protein [Hydrogenovibrio sp.]|uniref:asparaginase domain-containing protein n=1 Tax=Hydrogenovibrio sp. TaxID=2065821 RepID=UPI00286FD33C|nr:asparaginase domain-containing protein [Hydrogenovibrio sp.]MDR9497676.1 asparaginase domain-containing protein [Hydrogenovibrio sp.]